MNNYQMDSKIYKQWLKQHPNVDNMARQKIERKIKVLDFLAESGKEDLFELFDSGVFKKIIHGYLLMAINNNKLSSEVERDMIQELSYLFDTVGSECAEEYFYKNKP